ncbi:hypothetical protein B0F90DRAFT_1678778 [Multifurca ochricompacta]|uniref:UNC-45/Cro1/She4 central domain-containing protein n=1 Tax=Multifurca ochricompacta TaxID=376703 RepID=A0AAD4MCP7_9AGAM|nr:hypothetical protein B0F90DRAFT_1678778 [Multifurca ochricompacta]
MAVIDQVDSAKPIVPSLINNSRNPLPDELSYLITSFVPTNDRGKRSKAYLVLASYCQGVRVSMGQAQDGRQDVGTQALSRSFYPVIQAHITESQEAGVLAGFSFLTALFQVDWQVAADIFQQEAVLASISDILDLYPSDIVSREIARLLSQACGHNACRATLTTEVTQWLEAAVRQKKDVSLQSAAAVAITKLSRGAGTDALVESAQRPTYDTDRDLVELMKGILSGESQESFVDAVECLAYLSIEPSVKEDLSKDSAFLKKLFSFIPTRRRTSTTSADIPINSLTYGILNVIHNLSVYRPPLSPEQEQVMKLRRMTKSGTTGSRDSDDNHLDTLEDEQHVRERGRNLVQYGAINVLIAAIRVADSQGIMLIASQIFLNLGVDKENRGKILQSGGARALAEIIRKSFSAAETSQEQPEVDASVLQPIQAFAKLAITSSPTQVFGPDPGAIYDAIRPFSTLLTHSASSPLQRFEAMMALTNISSHSTESADRVAKANGLVAKIEFLMLEDHVLIRRAATELTCNLMAGSDVVFKRYSDSNSAKSRLHVLAALSDVDDLPTRLAASGALASLTSSPIACRLLYELECDHHRLIPILTTLIDKPLPGSESVESPTRTPLMLLKEETELKDLTTALIVVVKDNTENVEILRPAAEALKCLMDLGVVVPGV